MLFPEENAPLLKQWIIKRLADTTDVDADVLADYVLALLRTDADVESVRQICLNEIPDFLKDESVQFVQDVFETIQYKSYLPGAPPRPSQLPTGSAAASSYGNLGMAGAPLGPLNGARKRSYNDRGDGDNQDRGFHGGDQNGRQYKQPRRGGPGSGRGPYDGPHSSRGGFDGGRGGFDNGRGGFDHGRGGFDHGRGGFGGNRHQLNQGPPPSFPPMPQMPSPPPGMPAFDPANPLGALLAMQAMGFPVPGMPGLPPAASPNQTPPGPPAGRRRGRCRDYDEKGFCARGSNCHFEHGEHGVWTPPNRAPDEYNPATSLMTGVENHPVPNIQLRGGPRGRGHPVLGRGDFNNRKNGRSEFSSDRPNYDKSLSTIVVENIPEDKFTEDEVKAFFNEFGIITEVSMRPYKRLAIVKFADWDSANAAYKSPKVIFDNRFVKVYWYSSPDVLPQPASVSKPNGSPKSGRATTEPQIDIDAFNLKQQEVQKMHEEKQKKKQELDAARLALEKREQGLKDREDEKRKLLALIAAKEGKPAPPENGTKQEEANKEDSKAVDTAKLEAELAALEAEAESLGLDHGALPNQALSSVPAPRGGYRGRGGFRGRGTFAPRGFRGGYRGRGGAPFAGGSVMRLDNRPKSVSLAGVDFTDSEKDEGLRQYLLGVGDYTSLDVTPTLTTITFKERYIAENFMYKTPGCEIPGVGRVEMAWVKNAPAPSAGSGTLHSPSPAKADVGGAKKENGSGDVHMEDDGEVGGQNGASGNVESHRRESANLDYDVGDDEWS